MTTVRIASLTDVAAVAPLFDAYRQFYGQPADLALARTFIHDRLQNEESVILIAIAETGSIEGFCQLYPSFCSVEAKPIVVLYDLYVRPEARRRGIATMLLEEAERVAGSTGKARMDLSTAITNGPAQALYESRGWVRDEVFYVYSKTVGREDRLVQASSTAPHSR